MKGWGRYEVAWSSRDSGQRAPKDLSADNQMANLMAYGLKIFHNDSLLRIIKKLYCRFLKTKRLIEDN